MVRNSFRLALIGWAATGAILAGAEFAHAQPPQGNNGGGPGGPQGGWQNGPPQTYQRQRFDGSRWGRDRRRNDFGQSFPYTTPQVNSGWYQRPCPTHLDYFRLRSNEAPPPYYGNWNGGYGGWSGPVGVWENDGSGYGTPLNDGGVSSDQGISPRVLMKGSAAEQGKGTDGSDKGRATSGGNSESLPAPSK